MIEMAKKGLTNEKIDAIIAKANKGMRENITESARRYRSITCKCGHAWAMDKPATLENKAKPSRVMRIHRDEVGEITWLETVRKAGQCRCGRSLNHPKIRFDCNDDDKASIPPSIQPNENQLNYVKVDMDGMASIDNMIETSEGVE
jgi:CDGSH-type Zn-finger protein